MSEFARGVSVVVPLQDEQQTVGGLLESLARQTVLPGEVVVVDAGSTDRTAEIVRGFAAPFPIVLVPRGRLFPGQARNEGVSRSSLDWIAFADGGTRLRPDWLEALLVVAEATGADVVYGSYEPVCDSFFRECAAVAYVAPLADWGGRGPFVASSLMRRPVFEATGGFPPFRAAEDLILFEKIAASGARVAHAPRAVVEWQIAGGWASTFHRFAVYSYHNLAAGRGRYWHWGVARQYLVACLLLCSALAAGVGLWSFALVPAWLLARALRAAWQKRHSLGFATFDPRRLALSAALLAWVDLATAVGGIRHLLQRPSESVG